MLRNSTVSQTNVSDNNDPYLQATIDRFSTLRATDQQFADAAPLAEVNEAARKPELSAAQVIEVYLHGYANRPALGRRRYDTYIDPNTGDRVLRYLASFETITYSELHALVDALRAGWANLPSGGVEPGDFVTILGYTGAEYTIINLACWMSGIVTVPLHSTFTPHQIQSTVHETGSRVIASSIEYLSIAVEVAAQSSTVERLVVFDYLADVDAHRATLAQAQTRLHADVSNVIVTTYADEVSAGKELQPLPVYVPLEGDDPMATLMYSSGSTGTPKGASFRTSLIKHIWLYPLGRSNGDIPAIHYHNAPLSHVAGRGWLVATLSAGGTAYFEAKSDHSTFFEDLGLIRPTELALIPIICDGLVAIFRMEEAKHIADGLDKTAARDLAKRTFRENICGGRILSAACGSAPLSPATRDLLQSCLEAHIVDTYGATEFGTTIIEDGLIRQPPVVDYKLVDVSEDSFHNSDTPCQYGELCVKSEPIFSGYFSQPAETAEAFDADGFFKTGDIMAEVEPGRLTYIDRATNLLKLSAVGFVAVSKLEAAYVNSPEIEQIYIYGNSAQQYLLAVVVPKPEVLASKSARETISDALQQIADTNNFPPHEVPRDFIIEREPFSTHNGLVSTFGKLLRPALKAQYEQELESMYGDITKNYPQVFEGLAQFSDS